MNVPIPNDNISFNGTSEGFDVTYNFDRLGIRYVARALIMRFNSNSNTSVPAFLISPYIPADTLISTEGTMYAENSVYTHSSMIHFLQELWGLEGLNNRVQWAKTFEYIFEEKPRKDTPTNLTTPVWYGGSTGPQPSPFYKLNQPYPYYANLP
jgi:phospholipase C